MIKNVFKLTAVVLAFAIFGLSSCSDDGLGAPTGTWVSKDFTYTSDDGTSTQLKCYFMFSNSEYTNSSLKSGYTPLLPGLNVVIMPSSTGTVSGFLTAGKFLFKNFGIGDNEIGDDGEEVSGGYSFQMSEAKWNVIYYANIKDFLNSETSTPPSALTSNSYSEYTDFTKFSWKKALANWLNSYLN